MKPTFNLSLKDLRDIMRLLFKFPDIMNIEKKIVCSRNQIDRIEKLFYREFDVTDAFILKDEMLIFSWKMQKFLEEKKFFPPSRVKRAINNAERKAFECIENYSDLSKINRDHLKELTFRVYRDEFLKTLEKHNKVKRRFLIGYNVSACVLKAHTLVDDYFTTYRNTIERAIKNASKNCNFDIMGKCAFEAKMAKELGKLDFLNLEFANETTRQVVRSTRAYIRKIMKSYKDLEEKQIPIQLCFELVRLHFTDELLTKIENDFVKSYNS